MKQTGKCPKCGARQVYFRELKNGERCYIHLPSRPYLYIDAYICGQCGYLEEYITDVQGDATRKALDTHFKPVSD